MYITSPVLTIILITRLERGDFKLRVRALDVERQMDRARIVQKNIFHSVLACGFLNTGILLSAVGSGPFASKLALRTIFGIAAFVGARVPLGLRELKKLDEYNERYLFKKKR